MASNLDTTVTVFGGSGFLGRNVVRALCKRDYRVRVAVRRPELAGHLQPLGRVGQIHAVQANVRYPASVEAAMRDSQVAINLVGILAEGGGQSFDAVQVKGAETIAKAAADKAKVDDLSFLLLEQAQILDGELPEDPAAFAARLNRLVLQGVAAA